MPIAVYARASTTHQNVEPQLAELRRYAEAAGADEVIEYVDHGVSGRKGSRPALDAMMRDARRKRFHTVVAVKLDRIARSVRHLTALCAELEELDIAFICLTQAIDTSTSTGRLLLNVLGSIAEFEADLIRERVVAGLAAARRKGKRLGRRPVLVGDVLTRAKALQTAGWSTRAIAHELGVSKSAVHKTLSAASA